MEVAEGHPDSASKHRHNKCSDYVSNHKYKTPHKRMRIEKLFENLNLNDASQSKEANNYTKRLEDIYQDSQCFSIEIHKVHHYDDVHAGDELPRRRKKPKKCKEEFDEEAKQNSEDYWGSNTTSESSPQ